MAETARQKLRFMDPVLASAAEFARISGLGYTLIRQLMHDGSLPSCRIGKRLWILREPAIEWLSRQVEEAPASARRGIERKLIEREASSR